MATIKSYTDIDQSKKLAEILPLESADMYHFIDDTDIVGFGYRKITADYYSKTKLEYIPCWSLAALFDALPIIKSYCAGIRHIDKSYCCCYTEENHDGDLYWHYADNPVDACVTMIEQLHKLNLL